MTEENYELWCLCEHDKDIFKVTISPTKNIFGLKKVIAETRFPRTYRATDLGLTKINVDRNENAGQYQPNPGDVPLCPLDDISDVWPIKPSSGFVNVYVRLSPTVLGKRIRRSESPDELDLIKHSKLVHTAPSQMGKLSEYIPLQQDPETKILDDRPEQDSVAPASLLYDGFGHFLDSFRRREVFDLTTKRRDLEWVVDAFAGAMTARAEDDYWHDVKAMKAHMFLIGHNPGYNVLAAASVDLSDIHTDGHYNGPHEAVSCIVSFRNELVDFHSMPVVELTSHVARSHAQSTKSRKELYAGWRVPCLGLTIVGPYVTFYAVISLPNRQLRVVSLTPALSCVASAGEGDDRKALYAAFDGALALLRRIDEDAKKFLSTPPTIRHTDCRFPYISAVPKYNAPGEEREQELRFQILGLHPDMQDYRLMYIARTLEEGVEEGPKRVIMVKFTRRYSIALHAFCAERGHAPAIRGFKQIPGGWFVVAMDFILPPMSPSLSPDFPRLLDKWTEDLQNIVQSFHDAGFVHGDLREPNILCDGEQLKLIDYDWGGVVGEAYYPHSKLCPELMDGRDGTDPRITKDDDRRVLQDMLNGLKTKASCMTPR